MQPTAQLSPVNANTEEREHTAGPWASFGLKSFINTTLSGTGSDISSSIKITSTKSSELTALA